MDWSWRGGTDSDQWGWTHDVVDDWNYIETDFAMKFEQHNFSTYDSKTEQNRCISTLEF